MTVQEIESGTKSSSGTTDNRQAGATLTPDAYRQFFHLFMDWLDRDRNREAIEAAGSGNYEELATLCAAWARNCAQQR